MADAQIKYTVEEAAQILGWSIAEIKAQYARNAIGLRKMHDKAVATGKKVNGYTAQQLKEMTEDFEQRSK